MASTNSSNKHNQNSESSSDSDTPLSVNPQTSVNQSSPLILRVMANTLRLFSFPVRLICITLMRFAQRFWPRYSLTFGQYTMDPVQNVNIFIEEFEKKYGPQHPRFYVASYPEALIEAKKELRFMLVYLHNELHQDTCEFCQDVLTHKEVVSYINRNNIIFWACSLDSPEGHRVSQALREMTYPFLALIVLKNNQMTVVRKFEGQMTVESLLSQLQQSIEDNEGSIVSSRLERQTRDMNQQIRQQQDQDYLESLRADQEKARKRREELERKQREEQEIRRRIQKEQEDEQKLKQMRQQMAENLLPPPKAGSGQVIRLRVNFPNGRKVQRLFATHESIRHLFEFVFSQSDCPKRFKLKTNFPVRELPSTHPTVDDPQCRSTSDPQSEPITFAEFGIVKDEIVYLYDLDA